MPFQREQFIGEFVLLVCGMIVGFHITLFIRQNQCHLLYSRLNIRPKTLAGELGNRQFLFVGVLTAEQLVETRAKAVYDTWGKNIPGKLTFFSSGEAGRRLGLPLVSLPGVDDTYPPLKKSLMMIKYMHDVHLDEYQWFMRADDDVYVRTDKLVAFLHSLNSSDDIHLGHAGTGAKDEIGMLSLNPGDNYCMGGPGVIMSRSVIKKVAPHLEQCLQTAPTLHEDIELGRCIQRYTGVPCTWAYEMRDLFFHHYTEKEKVFFGDLDTKPINDAITLHPIKQPAYMRRLHVHFMSQRIQHLQYEAVKLQRVLRRTDRLIQEEENWLLTRGKYYDRDEEDFHHQLARNDTEQWNIFTSNSFFSGTMLMSPGTGIRGALKIEFKKILERETETLKEETKTGFAENIHILKINYGYRRAHPIYGVQYVMHSTLRSEKKILYTETGKTKQISSLQRRRFFFQLPFGSLFYDAKSLDNTLPFVHFLVPLEGRLETFRRFMKNFEEVCLKQILRVKLVIAYSSSIFSPREHKAVFKEYQYKYPLADLDLIWIDVAGNFSRGVALSLAADKLNKTDLLFLCDVDLVFSKEFLDRCRMNTVLGQQVYFPIMFSQFDPNLSDIHNNRPESYYTINADAGIWRTYSYGPVCLYGRDLQAVGGFNTSIQGWGWEDVDLYEKFVNYKDIDVFRAPDPGLIHVYHPVKCDPKLPSTQLDQCRGSKASGLASQKLLVRYILAMQKKGLK